MKAIKSSFWLLLFVCCVLFGVIAVSAGDTSKSIDRRYRVGSTPMHKVLLTQRGYIQFLRWELPVPEIREFTFCLWVSSNNLTHSHSIFSYSKDEKERLIRSWISSDGRSIHLEINGVQIFDQPATIVENRWYHICQSWEGETGRYALWIDDRIEVQGQAQEMINHVIKSGGDIVLGQEYTDFDKGLEEGIEGAVLGFNLLLASAFSPLEEEYVSYNAIPQPSISQSTRIPYSIGMPSKAGKIVLPPPSLLPHVPNNLHIARGQRVRYQNTNAIDLRRTSALMRRRVRRRSTNSNAFPGVYLKKINSNSDDEFFTKIPLTNRQKSKGIQGQKSQDDPLGLQLVKLSYVRCEIGRGSPYVGGSLMLISWTRTPVRIFGGAIIKNVKSECGKF